MGNSMRWLLVLHLALTVNLAGHRAASAQGGSAVYVPIVMRGFPLQTIFGIESARLNTTSESIAAAGATWVRKNALIWRNVEPTEGERNWAAMAALEQELLAARRQRLTVVLIVRGTPDWARQDDSLSGDGGKPSTCGPIRDDKLAAFARFMHDAVARYSTSQYGVMYWEMWNEPDVDPSEVTSGSPFGCYGDMDDPYYGGRAYGRMLQAIYPEVKRANSGAQVVLGGLLLDCNPNLNTGCSPQRITAGRFFEGVLIDGGGAYFDVANFHAYDWYGNTNTPGMYGSKDWNNSQVDGPLLLRKTAFVRELLTRYGVPNKPIMNTETAVICQYCAVPKGQSNAGMPRDDIQRANAYYTAQSYAAALSVGLLANVHYSYEGWNNSNMVFSATKLLPYYAFQEASEQLARAKYVGPLSDADAGVGSLAGYKFQRNNKPLWVVWSRDGMTHTLSVSGAPTFTTALGAPATASIGYEPVYVYWP